MERDVYKSFLPMMCIKSIPSPSPTTQINSNRLFQTPLYHSSPQIFLLPSLHRLPTLPKSTIKPPLKTNHLKNVPFPNPSRSHRPPRNTSGQIRRHKLGRECSSPVSDQITPLRDRSSIEQFRGISSSFESQAWLKFECEDLWEA